jgi:hypothetical protein
MKRLALVGFPDGLARQDITPTSIFREIIDDRINPDKVDRFDRVRR